MSLPQLHLSDIRQAEDGVWVIDINDDEEKMIKTKASKRLIPIHPFILYGLKLPAYVEHLKGRGEQRLFPELPHARDGYARNVTRWFNDRYRQKCGIVSNDGRKRDFHSFRATFSTHLHHQKIHEKMSDQVKGHSSGKGMGLVYNDPFPIKQIYDEVISKLDSGIDLTHLKDSKYVIRSE